MWFSLGFLICYYAVHHGFRALERFLIAFGFKWRFILAQGFSPPAFLYLFKGALFILPIICDS